MCAAPDDPPEPLRQLPDSKHYPLELKCLPGKTNSQLSATALLSGADVVNFNFHTLTMALHSSWGRGWPRWAPESQHPPVRDSGAHRYPAVGNAKLAFTRPSSGHAGRCPGRASRLGVMPRQTAQSADRRSASGSAVGAVVIVQSVHSFQCGPDPGRGGVRKSRRRALGSQRGGERRKRSRRGQRVQCRRRACRHGASGDRTLPGPTVGHTASSSSAWRSFGHRLQVRFGEQVWETASAGARTVVRVPAISVRGSKAARSCEWPSPSER